MKLFRRTKPVNSTPDICPYIYIHRGRGEGKTTDAIKHAALAQDMGYDMIVFVVPHTSWVNHIFKMCVDVLDMSRVQVHTFNMVVETMDAFRGYQKIGWIYEDIEWYDVQERRTDLREVQRMISFRALGEVICETETVR